MRTGHPRPGSPAAASAARRGGAFLLRVALAALLTVVALAGPSAAVAGASTFDDIYADYRRSQTIDPCTYSASQLRAAKRKIGSDAEQYAPEFPAALDRAIAGRGACKAGATEKVAATTTGAGGTGGAGTTGGATTGGGTGGGTTGGATPGGATGGATTGGASTTPGLPTVTTTPGQAPAPGATTETAPAAAAPVTPAPGAVSTPAPAAQDDAIAAAAETPARDDGPEAWTWAVLAGAIVLAALLGWALVNATGRIAWLAPIGHSMGEAGWRISLRWAEFRDWLRFGSGR